jgi:hypothetical protein
MCSLTTIKRAIKTLVDECWIVSEGAANHRILRLTEKSRAAIFASGFTRLPSFPVMPHG